MLKKRRLSIILLIAIVLGTIISGYICLAFNESKRLSYIIQKGKQSFTNVTTHIKEFETKKIAVQHGNSANRGFQHNKHVKVSKISFEYVHRYKAQLLHGITTLLNDLNVQFVISHGDLLAYERNATIYHDDDLDIRPNINDISKWETYCSKAENRNNPRYNLRFDERFTDIKKQKYNGVQAWLIVFKNEDDIQTFDDMNIHLDLVFSQVTIHLPIWRRFWPFSTKPIWPHYKINWNELREIKYYDVQTYTPNHKDTKHVLQVSYGNDYIQPNYKPYIIF